MSRFNKVIAIKLAGQPERLAVQSDLGYNLPRLTTWVGQVLLSPATAKVINIYTYFKMYIILSGVLVPFIDVALTIVQWFTWGVSVGYEWLPTVVPLWNTVVPLKNIVDSTWVSQEL